MATTAAARLDRPATESVTLPGAEVLQAAFEVGGVRGEDVLPAGLVPTRPTLLSFLVVRVTGGPLGSFAYAQARLSCRSGARARALVVATAVDAAGATATSLAEGWGIAGDPGPVVLDRRYDRVQVGVPAWGLDLTVRAMGPINGADIQYVVGLHPVERDGEALLAQVELDVELHRAERGRPSVAGEPRIGAHDVVPRYPVAATLGVGTVTLPRVRFLLQPEQPPHLGTEVL